MLYLLVILVAYPLALAGVVWYAVRTINGDVARIRERLGDAMASQYAQTMQLSMTGTLVRPAAFWGTALAVCGCAAVWAIT